LPNPENKKAISQRNNDLQEKFDEAVVSAIKYNTTFPELIEKYIVK
jgi:hypothetical protein